MTWQTFFLELF